jgi:hypothetical protein
VKRLSFTAFDDRVEMSSALTSASAISSAEFGSTLGIFDQIAYTVTAEQISGGNPKLGIKLQHSADGMNWLDKLVDDNVPTDNNVDASTQQTIVGFDDGTVPSLRLVRFFITISGVGPMNVAVRIDVVLNDVREGTFARKMRKILQRQGNRQAKCLTTWAGGSTLSYNPALAALVAQDEQHEAGGLSGAVHDNEDGTYTLANDVMVCVGIDGTMTFSTPGGDFDVQVPSSAGGAAGPSNKPGC